MKGSLLRCRQVDLAEHYSVISSISQITYTFVVPYPSEIGTNAPPIDSFSTITRCTHCVLAHLVIVTQRTRGASGSHQWKSNTGKDLQSPPLDWNHRREPSAPEGGTEGTLSLIAPCDC